MKEKRRDSKERILHTGESQRTDGKYLYKYVDIESGEKWYKVERKWQTTLKEGEF